MVLWEGIGQKFTFLIYPYFTGRCYLTSKQKPGFKRMKVRIFFLKEGRKENFSTLEMKHLDHICAGKWDVYFGLLSFI